MDVSTEKRSRVRKIFSPLRLECAKRFPVKQKGKVGGTKQISLAGRRALADRIQRGLEELAERRGKVSYVQIAERSGYLITEGAITNLLKMSVGNPSALTLYGLARALEIDPHELFDAALQVDGPQGFRESQFRELYDLYQQIEGSTYRQAASEWLDAMFRTVRAYPKRKADREPARRSKA